MLPVAVAAGVAGASLLGNMINSSADRESKAAGRAHIARMAANTDNQYAQTMNDIDSYYRNRGSLGTKQDALDYKAAIAGYSPDDFVYTPTGSFDDAFTKTREYYLNPYRDKIIADEVAAVQHSAAGAGVGRGSGAAQAIAKAVADKDTDLYKEAMQEYKDDRAFEYQKYNDYINMMQKQLDTKRAATENKMNMQSNLANDYYSTMDAYEADRLKAQQDRTAAGVNYATAMQGLY